MKRFIVTYDIVTPESAEVGDAAERGFLTPGAWRYPLETSNLNDDYTMTLREALDLIGDACENCGTWFAEVDGRQDFKTAAVETRALHPPRSITPSSYRRLARLLGAR